MTVRLHQYHPSLLSSAPHNTHAQDSRSWNYTKCRLCLRRGGAESSGEPEDLRPRGVCAQVWDFSLFLTAGASVRSHTPRPRVRAPTITRFPRLDPCEHALPVAHQPPLWPAAQAGSRRLHSAESSLRNTQQEHKEEHFRELRGAAALRKPDFFR